MVTYLHFSFYFWQNDCFLFYIIYLKLLTNILIAIWAPLLTLSPHKSRLCCPIRLSSASLKVQHSLPSNSADSLAGPSTKCPFPFYFHNIFWLIHLFYCNLLKTLRTPRLELTIKLPKYLNDLTCSNVSSYLPCYSPFTVSFRSQGL
jgi:hypothetical protein